MVHLENSEFYQNGSKELQNDGLLCDFPLILHLVAFNEPVIEVSTPSKQRSKKKKSQLTYPIFVNFDCHIGIMGLKIVYGLKLFLVLYSTLSEQILETLQNTKIHK